MTPLQFKLIISHMALSDTVIAAVRRCLVDNEPQAIVASEMGMKPPQLSRAIRSVQEKYEKILEQYGWEAVQVVLPKELVRGVRDIEVFFVEPLIKAKLDKKKRRRSQKV